MIESIHGEHKLSARHHATVRRQDVDGIQSTVVIGTPTREPFGNNDTFLTYGESYVKSIPVEGGRRTKWAFYRHGIDDEYDHGIQTPNSPIITPDIRAVNKGLRNLD